MDARTFGEFYMTIAGSSVLANEFAGVYNPATAEIFATAPVASRDRLDEAVAAAKAAFPAWSATPIAARRQAISAYAGKLREEVDTLARLLTLEQGKPLPNARSEVVGAIAYLESYCRIDLEPEILRDKPEQHVELRRRSLGVVGAITAWNYPVLLALWKIGPALAAGNTIVLKPAPSTPLTTLTLGQLSRGILPDGVLNVINGGNEVGAALVGHRDVRKIAFTGSSETGKAIMAAAAPTLKRLTLELGGNDAGIVLDDVDPKAVANDLFWAKFSNCGQVCAGLKRLFVHERVHDALVDSLIEVAKGVRVGEGFTEGVQMGPLQNAAQRDRLLAMFDNAKARGAKLLHIGEVPDGPGYWFPITLIGDLPSDSDVVCKEAFGPLLTIHRFNDEDDALARANATEYGLGASVWAADITRGAAVAERMEAGTTWVNQHPAMGPDIPFGGIKSSGLGVEGARWGLEEYTSIQVVNIKRG
jgi:acyl-CoA reductase-like NAD-dependent aldehyde dehydrogenase